MIRLPEARLERAVAPAVALRAVWKTYGLVPALRDVTLELPSGRIVAVLGPNGAGKSTLLRVAAGLVRPTRGVVRVLGADPRADGIRSAVGYAGHLTFLYGALTAAENLRFYAELYHLPPPAAASALERFGLEPVRHRRVRELSRGMVQRLSLARALLHDPRVLLLDEPFTGLDAGAAQGLAALLSELRASGRTVLLATHDWGAPRDLADDAVVLRSGRIVHRAPGAALSPADLPRMYAGGG